VSCYMLLCITKVVGLSKI